MQPLRVLLVDHAPVVGGVEAMLCDLVSAVDRAEVEPVIVADPRSPALARFRQTGAEVRPAPLEQLRHQRFAGPRLLASAAHLARLARRERAHVIHTFTARTHVIGSLAARLAGLPLLWRLNDDTLPLPLARLLGRAPKTVFAVSGFLAGRYHSLPAPLRVVSDGVPVPGESNPHPSAPRVTLAARLVRWKGHEVFIRGVALAARRLPKLQAEIVGSVSPADDRPGLLAGGEPYHRGLLALAGELGLGPRLTFTGFRERQALFAGAALAVHASILPEPFGRVILEAMALGLPVIGVRAGAVPEIVLNGLTGRLVPAGDVTALAEAMVGLLSDPSRARALGEAGRARVHERFALDGMAQQFTAAWQEAAG